eukprot:129705_1
MAVGYNAQTKTVVGIGGSSHPHQLFTFMVENETVSDYNATYSPIRIQGATTYYTQVDDTLWILSTSGGNFVTLNLETYSIQQTNITFPSAVSYGTACLTSYEQSLFIVGGNRQMNEIQIYDILNGNWVTFRMVIVGRRSSACVVVNSLLYTVGGVGSGGAPLNSVVIYTTGAHISGHTMKETLPVPLYGARAVAYGSDILLIGGTNDVDYSSDIVVIHTATESIEICGSLTVAAAWTAPVLVDRVLYIFGGYNGKLPAGQTGLNIYQRMELEITPTVAPITATPTSITTSPTMGPTTTAETVNTPLHTSSTTGSVPVDSTTRVTSLPVEITTSDEAGKDGMDKDVEWFTEHRVMIAVVIGSVVLAVVVLIVILIRRKKKKRVEIGGAYDAFLRDSYDKDQVGKNDYHKL